MIDRLEEIYARYISYTADRKLQLEKEPTSAKRISFYCDNVEFVGIAEYLLHKDLSKMHSLLSESVQYSIDLYTLYETGVMNDFSYVSMLNFKSLYLALFAGLWDEAEELAAQMGNHYDLEKKSVHPWTRSIGYTLKYFVLQDRDNMIKWAEDFTVQSYKKCNKSFVGFSDIFNGILGNDLEVIEKGFDTIVKKHKVLSRSGNTFGDSIDSLVYVWGVGMANLCRHYYKIPIKGYPPIIPDDLLATID